MSTRCETCEHPSHWHEDTPEAPCLVCECDILHLDLGECDHER